MFQIVERTRERVCPAIEQLLIVRGDRAKLGFLAARRDDELVVVKEVRAALALLPSLLAVAEKLIDGFRDRFLDLRRLAFDDDDRQAVEEQNDIGDDVVLGA